MALRKIDKPQLDLEKPEESGSAKEQASASELEILELQSDRKARERVIMESFQVRIPSTTIDYFNQLFMQEKMKDPRLTKGELLDEIISFYRDVKSKKK